MGISTTPGVEGEREGKHGGDGEAHRGRIVQNYFYIFSSYG